MSKLVMGYWDCKYCGTKKILGTIRDCPNCGHVRDKETEFYMDGVRYLTQEESKTKGRGPDWICPYCDSLNSTLDTHCRSCGCGKFESKEDYFNRINSSKKYEESASYSKIDSNVPSNPICSSYEDYSTPKRTAYNYEDDSTETRKGILQNLSFPHFSLPDWNYTSILKFGVIFLSIILIIGFITYLVIPKNVLLTVDSKTWSRSISIEEYKAVDESDWSLPTGGRLHYTNEEIHHYDTVLDHYETKTRTYTVEVLDGYDTHVSYSNNGDGTFSEHTTQVPRYRTETKTETYQDPVYKDVPVFRTKYYYEIDKWVPTRSVNTNGVDNDPYWGDVVLDKNEREGNKSGSYNVIGMVKNKEKSYSADYDLWESIKIGRTYKLKVSIGVIWEIIE